MWSTAAVARCWVTSMSDTTNWTRPIRPSTSDTMLTNRGTSAMTRSSA